MDIIESGESPVRSRRRMVVAAAVALVVLGGAYGLRHATASRQPPRHPAVAPTTDTVTWTPPSRGVVAAIPDDQRLAAMQSLPASDHGGAVGVIGSDFANGSDRLGLSDESLPRKGRYSIDMTCLGTGGVWVTIDDSDAAMVSSDQGLWIECTDHNGFSTVPMTLSRAALQFYLQPVHNTVAVFAYAVHAVKAA